MQGLKAGWDFRMWDFGKLWGIDVMAESVTHTLVLDTDVLMQSSVFDLWRRFHRLRARDPQWLLAAVPEPSFSKDAATPWEMRGQRRGYFNSGVMLLNLDRMRDAQFISVMVPNAMREFMATKWYRQYSTNYGDRQYPPEQWVFNVALGMNQRLFLALQETWSVSCVTESGPWGGPGGDVVAFESAKRRAHMLHYCNSMYSYFLPYDLCKRIEPPQSGMCGMPEKEKT